MTNEEYIFLVERIQKRSLSIRQDMAELQNTLSECRQLMCDTYSEMHDTYSKMRRLVQEELESNDGENPASDGAGDDNDDGDNALAQSSPPPVPVDVSAQPVLALTPGCGGHSAMELTEASDFDLVSSLSAPQPVLDDAPAHFLTKVAAKAEEHQLFDENPTLEVYELATEKSSEQVEEPHLVLDQEVVDALLRVGVDFTQKTKVPKGWVEIATFFKGGTGSSSHTRCWCRQLLSPGPQIPTHAAVQSPNAFPSNDRSVLESSV